MQKNSSNQFSQLKNDMDESINNSPESISPTPSPKPSHNFPQFSLNLTPSTSNQLGISYSGVVKESKRGRKFVQQGNNVNRGHWSQQQNKKYHWFLQIHYVHFVNRHMRRMDKIFKTMELFIGTRQAEQCRSHHQKMQKKYLNFATIIVNLRRLHYNCLDIEPIIVEMSNEGVSLIDGLATIQNLKQQQQVDPTLWQLKERKKSSSSRRSRGQKQQQNKAQDNENIDLHGIEQQKYEEVEQNRVNMLQESIINIGELNLYHQKEDHCSIFNSLL